MDQTIGTAFTPPDLGRWAWLMIRHPWTFFRSVSAEGGYKTPLLYLLFWEAVASVLGLVLGFIPGVAGPSPMIRVLWAVAGPLVAVGVGFFMTAVLFVIWHLLGSPHPYHTAFRCWALLAPLSVLGAFARLVPYLFLGVMVYGFFLVAVASIETHRIPARRAWGVWSLVLVFLLSLQILLVIVNVVRSQRPMMPRLSGEDLTRLSGQEMMSADVPPESMKEPPSDPTTAKNTKGSPKKP